MILLREKFENDLAKNNADHKSRGLDCSACRAETYALADANHSLYCVRSDIELTIRRRFWRTIITDSKR